MGNQILNPHWKAKALLRKSLLAGFLITILALELTTGCATVGPDYVPPESDMPDAWHQELTKGLSEGEAALQTWWTIFDDPVLNSLIDRAAEGNLDLRIAFARIQEARALRGVAAGRRVPDLDGTGTAARSRVSEEIVPVLPNRTDNFFGIGLDASWEIDVWGRIRRSIESADAGLEASVENYHDVLIVLYADVASTYVDVRTLQERLRLARGNVDLQRQTVQLTKDRYEAEIASLLEVRQAELNLASTEAVIPTLNILLHRAIHRLGVLLGQHPGTLYEELATSAPVPIPPEQVIVGLPVDLLRQRPDIRRAERELAAQTARIGVATADLYPRFSLSGAFAFEATDLDDLFESGSEAWSFGPAFRWNLFDGGRVRGRIQAEEARTEQLLHLYENIVLLALEDVENAMVGYTQERERRDALARSVAASEESVDLVVTLYKTGLTDFQNVLDMQRALFQQQDLFAQSEGDAVNNLIRIYRALGGGWAPVSEPREPIEEN
jgi:NodT family efflux transporter outer membrane factor (OMF) lipoprotein